MARNRRAALVAPLASVALIIGACTTTEPLTESPQVPRVAPEQPAGPDSALSLDPDTVEPMDVEVLAIDLPTVARVALAESIDVLQAREAVEIARGQYDAARSSVFPALAPTAVFDRADGFVRATEGNIVDVGFNTFRAVLAIDWVINPGLSYYEIVASKKRLMASEHTERAVMMKTLRDAAVQYYDLALAQGRVAVAKKALEHAEEQLRVSELNRRTGVGDPADQQRARARFARRSREVVAEMNRFYQASVTLAHTLRLEPQVTLVPSDQAIKPTQLVRDDLVIEELLGIAVAFRPDLQTIDKLVQATEADTGAARWGGFGPTFSGGYEIGGIIGTDIDNESSLDNVSGFRTSQAFRAGVGFRLDLSTLGNLRTADAVEEQMRLEALRRLDTVKSQVVRSLQSGRAANEIIPLAEQESLAADEARRLVDASFEAGTITILDVLQADEALAKARLSRIEAVVRYNQSQVDLVAALGVLDELALFPHKPSEPPTGKDEP